MLSHKKSNLPQHVGIIMDGNRRWAKSRGLPTLVGHKRGYDRAMKIVEHAFNKGVSYLTLFAFSRENWNRSKDEVAYLMDLLLKTFEEQSQKLHKQGIKITVIGGRDRLSKDILSAIDRMHALTKNNKRGFLQLAFNYGGRREIVDAVNAIAKTGKRITEAGIAKNVYTKNMPDPDLIIRTSGEERISGFLLWQAAYSELLFSPKMWPAFTTHDFDEALNNFAARQRRFGA